MMKRKHDKIDGRNLWDMEIELLTKIDIPLDEARYETISRWMDMGDLRPLAAAITEGYVSDEMLTDLADLIRSGAQLAVPRSRGKPKQAAKQSRDLIFWLMYEPRSKRSDDAFREIAKKFGVSEQSVRQAVTKFRKPPKVAPIVETL
jgi:hypothetical protein